MRCLQYDESNCPGTLRVNFLSIACEVPSEKRSSGVEGGCGQPEVPSAAHAGIILYPDWWASHPTCLL